VNSGINPCIRFTRYDKGGHFDWHRDGNFVLDDENRSVFTLMIYLSEDFEGGETLVRQIFTRECSLSSLIFQCTSLCVICVMLILVLSFPAPMLFFFLQFRPVPPIMMRDATGAINPALASSPEAAKVHAVAAGAIPASSHEASSSSYDDQMPSDVVAIVPRTGAALVFNHDVIHTGKPVIAGRKYILRTDIMFRRVERVDGTARRVQALLRCHCKEMLSLLTGHLCSLSLSLSFSLSILFAVLNLRSVPNPTSHENDPLFREADRLYHESIRLQQQGDPKGAY
jgi:hypothetical protein